MRTETTIADAIREEIKRQARTDKELAIGITCKTDAPDTIRLIGRLDLYAIAKALKER